MRGHLALCWNVFPRWMHVSATKKKNIDFLLFYDFVPEIYKKKKNNDNNNTEINGMKFKRGCFDKMDWNTWIPDSDVNENKRLKIGSTSSFSGVLIFSFFLFSLFFWLYLKLWISYVNDGKRPFFFLLLLLFCLGNWGKLLKDTIAGFCQKYKLFVKQLCLLGKSSQKRSFFWIFWIEKNDFRPEKWSFNKSTNNRSFPKGLVQAFCQKFELFIKFLGGQIKPEKVVFG